VPSSTTDDDRYPGPGTPMLGARLRIAAEAVHSALQARMAATGYVELRPAHFALLKFPGPHGSRPSELAARTGLRKQALNPLINDLEEWGYVTRTGHEHDGRGRIVVLTDRGLAMVAELRMALEEFDTRLRDAVGDARVEDFYAVLDAVAPTVGEAGPRTSA
jgi:DNA-binding MarR family transcriptional regulator